MQIGVFFFFTRWREQRRGFIWCFGEITDGHMWRIVALIRPVTVCPPPCGRTVKTRPSADVWVWDACFCFGFSPCVTFHQEPDVLSILLHNYYTIGTFRGTGQVNLLCICWGCLTRLALNVQNVDYIANLSWPLVYFQGGGTVKTADCVDVICCIMQIDNFIIQL